MTIIRPSVQNLEHVYTCVHLRTRAYVWNILPWYAEEYRCVENLRDADLRHATAYNINHFISSHLHWTTRRNYGDRSQQLGSSQHDQKLLPTQTEVTSNFHVITSELVAFCAVPSFRYSQKQFRWGRFWLTHPVYVRTESFDTTFEMTMTWVRGSLSNSRLYFTSYFSRLHSAEHRKAFDLHGKGCDNFVPLNYIK